MSAQPTSEDIPGYRMLIGGRWQEAEDGRRMTTSSPFTGREWASAPEAGAADVDAAVRSARQALEGPWGKLTASERGRLMRRLGTLIDERADHLARIESTDNGKLLREMSGQMHSLSGWYEYFGGLADKLEGSTPPPTKDGVFSYTMYEPVGVVGAILPWNSPILLMSFKVAPALAAGCTLVVKPSEQTSISTLEFAKLFEEAGFPPGVFNVVTGAREAGAALAGHPDVDKIAFTGSTEGGIKVMESAARHVARVTLELGGKSANIVFEDADLDSAVNGVLAGIFAASGQTCIAGSRLLIARSVAERFLDRLAQRTRSIKLGDPLDAGTEMGPCATRDQLEKVAGLVDRAVAAGASVLCGGKRPSGSEHKNGFFYEPTILTNVTNDMEIAREEVFGPVLAVIPFDGEDEAIRIANDSRFGLGAGVWTTNVKRAHRVAHAIRAGSVWVNCYRLLSYNVPFGGFKMSGIGRENGIDAIRDYAEPKAIWINTKDEERDPFTMG